jgi:cellulose biosynthesis protein BcsQ
MGHSGRQLVGARDRGTDNRNVTALTIGITTARDPACKRGLSVNLAASLARSRAPGADVCVVDADPFTLDVTTRLAVIGPDLEDFAGRSGTRAPRLETIASVGEPPLWVLPSAGAGVGRTHRALGPALTELQSRFDVVVCDLVGGPSGPARVLSDRLAQLDWLLLAVTPEIEPVEAAARFIEQFESARVCGHVAGSVRLGIVTTGDEGSTGLSSDVVAKMLDEPVLASVRQLWGRAVPNLGFGAALGIGELDESVTDLFECLAGATEPATSRA